MTVMSLWRILIVRYSRSSPKISLLLLLEDLARPVMRIDDVVADLELDVLELAATSRSSRAARQ